MKQLRKWTVAAFCSLAGVLYAQTPSYSTYQVNKDLTNFTDWTASSLSKNFKDKHLKGMESQLMKQLAEKMLRGDYNSAYLLQSYKPIPSNKVLEQQLKLTNGYSRYENITGVYLEAGENVVLVGDLHGRTVGLLIPDWMRQPTLGYQPTKDPEGWGLKKQEILLHEGVNVINVKKAGNVYVDYFADDPDTAPAVTIHFVTGKVNGYFDATVQSNEDWNRLLDNAVSPVMDVKGKYIQLANTSYFVPFANGKDQSSARVQAADHWSASDPNNMNVLYPRLHTNEYSNNTLNSTWWYRNGSFLRLKNVELGYQFDKKLVQRWKMQNLRIYVQGSNLAVWDHVKMWDPEIGNSGARYPINATWTFGLDVTF